MQYHLPVHLCAGCLNGFLAMVTVNINDHVIGCEGVFPVLQCMVVVMSFPQILLPVSVATLE